MRSAGATGRTRKYAFLDCRSGEETSGDRYVCLGLEGLRPIIFSSGGSGCLLHVSVLGWLNGSRPIIGSKYELVGAGKGHANSHELAPCNFGCFAGSALVVSPWGDSIDSVKPLTATT